VISLVLDIEVNAPVGVLRDEDRQADRLGQRNALAIDPGCEDPGHVRARESHDEGDLAPKTRGP
jgi:hypothetical protein